MKHITPITNTTLELSDCLGAWEFDAEHQVWCLEEILYTLKATSPDFQKLNIYVPAEYMKEGGIVIPDAEHGAYTAKTAPVDLRTARPVICRCRRPGSAARCSKEKNTSGMG